MTVPPVARLENLGWYRLNRWANASAPYGPLAHSILQPVVEYCAGPPGALKRPQRFPQRIGFVWHFCMGAQGAFKTAKNGGFRPGQSTARTPRTTPSARARGAAAPTPPP
jgi:hypothetical protein